MLLLLSFISSNKTRKRTTIILLALLNLALIWTNGLSYFVEAMKNDIHLGAFDIILLVLRIVAVLFIYALFMQRLFGKIRFKTRRQKEFERQMQGKNKSYLTPLIIFSVTLITGIFGWIYYQINYTSDYKTDRNVSIAMTVISVLALGYFIFKAVTAKKLENTASNQQEFRTNQFNAKESPMFTAREAERTCVFIIQTDDAHYFYKGTYKGRIALNELVGTIGDYYYISSYGTLNAKSGRYDLFGVKTSYFDIELLNQIKLTRFESAEIEAVLPYLEKNHTKEFNLDENNNPINSFDA